MCQAASRPTKDVNIREANARFGPQVAFSASVEACIPTSLIAETSLIRADS